MKVLVYCQISLFLINSAHTPANNQQICSVLACNYQRTDGKIKQTRFALDLFVLWLRPRWAAFGIKPILFVFIPSFALSLLQKRK